MTNLPLEAFSSAGGRQRYLHPLQVAVTFSVFGGLLLLIVFGLILFPAGDLLTKQGALFLLGGITLCAIGGIALGTLCFTDPGRRLLDRLGL